MQDKMIDPIGYNEATQELLKEALEKNGLNPEVLEQTAEKEVITNIEDARINHLQKQGINPYGPHKLFAFDGVKKHKSIWRAMRRGHTSVNGEEFPNRPFNNRKNKKINEIKKNVYGELRKVAARS